MPEGSILSDDFIRELISVGEVDIVVGLPTYNDGRTVGQVVQAIRTGLLKYFPRERVVIINADGGSRDGTQDLVRAASISDLRVTTDVRALRTLHSISTQYEGGPANGISNPIVYYNATPAAIRNVQLCNFTGDLANAGDYLHPSGRVNLRHFSANPT